MTKNELKTITAKHKQQTKDALQLLYDNINKGQQKQIVKRAEIQKLFDTFGVEYTN